MFKYGVIIMPKMLQKTTQLEYSEFGKAYPSFAVRAKDTNKHVGVFLLYLNENNTNTNTKFPDVLEELKKLNLDRVAVTDLGGLVAVNLFDEDSRTSVYSAAEKMKSYLSKYKESKFVVNSTRTRNTDLVAVLKELSSK